MWTMAIPPPTTPYCDKTASKCCAKAAPCAHAGAAAIRQLARSPASNAGQAMGKRFDMRVIIIRLRGRDCASACRCTAGGHGSRGKYGAGLGRIPIHRRQCSFAAIGKLSLQTHLFNLLAACPEAEVLAEERHH